MTARRQKTFALTLVCALACREAAEKPPIVVTQAAVSVPVASAASSTASSSGFADSIMPASPDTTVVTADSALPPRTYADVPGWLVLGLRHPVLNAGAIVNGKTIEMRTVVVDSGIAVFPPNDHWKSVGRGTPLVYISDRGEKIELYPDGESVWEGDGNSTVVRVRATHIPTDIGWMVPRSVASSVRALPVVDVASPDGNRRTWSAGAYTIRAQRTDKLTAELFAEANGLSVKRKYLSGINPEADSSMGVESDTALDLKGEKHLPKFFAAYEFAPGVAALIFVEYGYECTNIRVVTFRPGKIDWQEEWYTGPCTR